MISVALAANITALDTTGPGLAVIDVDFRQQGNAGGSISAEIAATAPAANTVTIPANITAVDNQGGSASGTSVVDVDFRQQPNAARQFNAKIPTASITYAGAAAPSAPTLGQTAAGALGAHTVYVKVTYVDANGNESLASAEASQAVSANNVATVTSPGASTGAVKWNWYASATAGAETLQNASPINLGTGAQEPNTGITTTGRSVPANATLVTGACNVTVAATGLAAGACTVTVSQ